MPQVSLQFLGAGDAFASGGRFQTCFYLDGGDEPLLIDCGATSLVPLKRAQIDTNAIGSIVLTHLHGDHFAGLPFLILDGQFSRRTKTLQIAGPPGTDERLQRVFEALYPGATGVERAFETRVVELADGVPCDLGPAVVTPFAVCHPSGAPAYALRIQYADKVIAYSGDTGWTASLLAAADGADLFVCECNFYERKGATHLDWQTLANERAQLTCKRLIVTHMGEDMLARVDEIDVEAAADGLNVEI
jgi:ribonuclease BN (tRNA processing enzyme)